MKNASTAIGDANERILVVGRTGAGKTAQIWTLPGKKFAYLFDPNSMRTLQGLDVDVEEFYPDFGEIDPTLKAFNTDKAGIKFKSDRPKEPVEPKSYERWVDDINKKVADGFFKPYQWLIFDSLTFLVKIMMDRQLFINMKMGDLQDRSDYRIVGNKITDIWRPISALPINIYATGHISTYQDEKTKKIDTSLNLPGSGRTNLPLMFTNIWEAKVREGDKGKVQHVIRTRPDPRGLLDIRSSISGMQEEEDVTIADFKKAEQFGIGKLLTQAKRK